MRFFNRELSWLDFNARVLEEAQDRNNPVFERLKFLAITASNLDEFFMVRVSGLLTLVESGYDKPDFAGLTPSMQLKAISDKVHDFVSVQYNCLNRSLLPALTKAGYRFVKPRDVSAEKKDYIWNYFRSTLFPILTPMAIDKSRPFPLLLNRSLNIIVRLEQPEEDSDDIYAVVQVPSVESRVLELPGSGGERDFVLLEDIIKLYLPHLFQGYTVLGSYCFRITRNSDLEIHDDSDDLLIEIERSLRNRKWGEPNRLEAEKGIDAETLGYLCAALEFDDDDVYIINGMLDLTMFFSFYGKGAKTLKDAPAFSCPPMDFESRGSVFDAIYQKDMLVHHPYESFDCVVRFVEEAAADPNVLAIKQTLYRVSGHSPIIQALINAAISGKQVTVLVELQARFDEENNIVWARKLEQAGCHVVYGFPGLKTHCKICLVVRREEARIQRYVHLGTGNYNDSTAKIYTDFSFFTRRETFGSDVSALFNTLTGYSEPPEWKKISVAPTSLRETLESWIENEIELAKNDIGGRIVIKVNSLVDKGMIEALYRASAAGVAVELIVRGICCLKPGVAGLSDNIRVISIVGRLLEHSRVFMFANGGNARIFLSSADLMPRNLDRRVEIAFPVEQEDLKARIAETLGVMLNDNTKARVLDEDGVYIRADRGRKKHANSQLHFFDEARVRYEEYLEDIETEAFFSARNESVDRED